MKPFVALKLLLALLPFCCSASAVEYTGSGISTIKFITSYNGNGDVMFRLENPIEACVKGYWMSSSDVGFQANMSMLLAAFQANSNVRIYGLPGQDWPGSSGSYCKVYSVEYHK
ncbi:hypothetical protein [Rheinheimera sp. NSM]|uniref:hypothetical protein n=1 Tax=Rheinheimera sp. NSM TaxID=3457884 RepID=UPI004036D90C